MRQYILTRKQAFGGQKYDIGRIRISRGDQQLSSDDVQENNDNYLAGVREIGVRSEYTDGRERPRLRLKSVEFEGPYYEKWPPETHQRIFIESPNKEEPEKYAREVIRNFLRRVHFGDP